MNKFEGKKTQVKGFIIDLSNGKSYPFETLVDYTRTNAKAVEFVIKEQNIDPTKYAVAVSELVNEKSEIKRYSNGGIALYAEEIFDSEKEAREYATKTNMIVRKINLYRVTAQVFGAIRHEENNKVTYSYVCEPISAETFNNCAKNDQRSLLNKTAIDNFGCCAAALHNVQKQAKEVYACITKDNLELCVIKKDDNNEE